MSYQCINGRMEHIGVEKAFDELLDTDWQEAPSLSILLKCKFYEDGYILMANTFVSVYGEMVHEEAIRERFLTLNPYAEMLPKVILKHVKESVQRILSNVPKQEGGGIQCKVTLVNGTLTIWHEIVVGDIRFLFNYEPKLLPNNQYLNHVMKPTMMKSLVLKEENAYLKRKIEAMEKKHYSSSSSASGGRINFGGNHSGITGMNDPNLTYMEIFLNIQNHVTSLPKSSQVTASASPPKGVNSASTSTLPVIHKVSSIATGSILYEDNLDKEIVVKTECITDECVTEERGRVESSEENIEREVDFRFTVKLVRLHDALKKVVDEILNLPPCIKIEEEIMFPELRKIHILFRFLLKVSNEPHVAPNIPRLIQNLIDGVIDSEEFVSRLSEELMSPIEPLLIDELTECVPLVREALISGKLEIEGIRPPPVTPYRWRTLRSSVTTTQGKAGTSSSSPCFNPSPAIRKTRCSPRLNPPPAPSPAPPPAPSPAPSPTKRKKRMKF